MSPLQRPEGGVPTGPVEGEGNRSSSGVMPLLLAALGSPS